MKTMTFAAVGLLGFALATASAEEASLPFSVSVTKMPLKSPDYIGPTNPDLGMDYPFCPVLMDGEYWILFKNGYRDDLHRYKGTNIENAKRVPDSSASFPVRAPYMLGGMWYDASAKKLYAPMHCETPGYAGNIHRQIHLATSTNKGLSWHYEGAIVTRDDPKRPPRTGPDFSGLYWDSGDGDFYTYVDERGGYLYLYTNHYTFPKTDAKVASFVRHHVARCAISDKMAPGKWQKFYNGSWSEPGLGGKASWVEGYSVMYNTYLKKYVSFNYGNSLSFCSDLSKQDWSPSITIPGRDWGCDGLWGWWVTDADKANIYTGGRTLFVYTFWMKAPGSLYKIDFGPGKSPAHDGYYTGGYGYTRTTTDPMTLYGYEPLFESADPIENRHTRRVPCTSPEMSYSGSWTDDVNDQYHDGGADPNQEKMAKVSQTANGSAQLSFQGAAIYWRALKAPNCGKADVFLDNVLQKTVDCYADAATPYQFAFVKTGLDPKRIHTIKVVVRGEKNSRSSGTAVKHIQFEYAAESYRASDGFSSVPGKNQWYNLQRNGSADTPMVFKDPAWLGGGKCEVGYYHMVPDASDAVRKWVAPHAGSVRIEGRASLDASGGDGVNVSILHNAATVWPTRLVTFGHPAAHDATVDVAPGDALYFVVNKNATPVSDRTTWDPVVTYLPPR
jgi:hypothetical protein